MLDISPELLAVDDRLATPGAPYEILDGELVHVPPSDEPHGRRQSKISALIEAHAARDFTVASEMLTRTSKTNDFAPDVSVYPRARDPRTGGRQLEELAFEVVSTESLSHAGRKAARLIERGVRRVFAINIERSRALEWSASFGGWTLLDSGAHIEDRALAVPLPIAVLLDAGAADGPMAHALIAKKTPEIEAAVGQGEQRGFVAGRQAGLTEGMAAALLTVLDAREITLRDSDRARILGERDPEILARWTVRAATCDDIAQLFETR